MIGQNQYSKIRGKKSELQLIARPMAHGSRGGRRDPVTESDVLGEPVSHLLRESLAANTMRGYASDLAVFGRWGGSIPTDPATVARFIADLSTTHAVASISRMLSALGKAHRSTGDDDPTDAEVVKSTMSGVRRRYGIAQRQARPILRDDLFAMLDRLGDRPKDIRDRAMLLIGFVTAMRRSELVALNVEDVENAPRGLMVTIRRSKTDQEGRGHQIAVPYGRTRHCPVRALSHWLTFAGIDAGPIFLSVNKHGHVLPVRVSGEAVSHVIKSRLTSAGYDPVPFSGHSLRAGFVTAAAMAGAPSHKIRQTTGHRSEASLARYIRQVDLFHDPAIARVL